jgi:hypothetical protein
MSSTQRPHTFDSGLINPVHSVLTIPELLDPVFSFLDTTSRTAPMLAYVKRGQMSPGKPAGQTHFSFLWFPFFDGGLSQENVDYLSNNGFDHLERISPMQSHDLWAIEFGGATGNKMFCK